MMRLVESELFPVSDPSFTSWEGTGHEIPDHPARPDRPSAPRMACGATARCPSQFRDERTAWMQVNREPVQPGPADRWTWILWVFLLTTVASTAYTMNRAFAASGTAFLGLESTGAGECRGALPSHADGGPGGTCNGEQIGWASSTACAGGARPDLLREADEVELRWLLSGCPP